MERKASAIWRGTGRGGGGTVSSDSGALKDTPQTFRTRFEDEPGTNPEELIAAAHAGCFTMALAFQLEAAGLTPTRLTTRCTVTLEPEKAGEGFRITRSALTLEAEIPDADLARFEELAETAKRDCPVSKVLNADITLDKRLL